MLTKYSNFTFFSFFFTDLKFESVSKTSSFHVSIQILEQQKGAVGAKVKKYGGWSMITVLMLANIYNK